MLIQPMDVLSQFPIRKSKRQKQAFMDAVQSYATELEYPVRVEKGSFGANNMVIGDPDGADYLVTAHYDTPANMPVPNFITPLNPVIYFLYQILFIAILLGISVGAAYCVYLLADEFWVAYLVWWVVYFGLLALIILGPANKHNANDNTSGVVTVLETMKSMPKSHRHRVCFVLFDLEEAGRLGSASYRKAHKESTDKQLILNLDCMGDGSELLIFPTKKLRNDKEKLRPLANICGYWGKKSLLLKWKGFYTYPSDQNNFPYAAAIAAFRRKKGIGLYCSRIHTGRDTVLETTNVNILRAALVSLICQ